MFGTDAVGVDIWDVCSLYLCVSSCVSTSALQINMELDSLMFEVFDNNRLVSV